MADCMLVLLVAVCFMVASCTACEGKEREEIIKLLLKESSWETLAGRLDVEDGELNRIRNCERPPNDLKNCYRELVKYYSDKIDGTCRQVAYAMADVLEEHMDNKRLAAKLRKTFENTIEDLQPPQRSSPTVYSIPSHHKTDSSQPSSQPQPHVSHDNGGTESNSSGGNGGTKQFLWVWLEDNQIHIGVAVTLIIIILSSVCILSCGGRAQESKVCKYQRVLQNKGKIEAALKTTLGARMGLITKFQEESWLSIDEDPSPEQLVSTLLGRIKLDPAEYDTFIVMLRGVTGLDQIVTILQQ